MKETNQERKLTRVQRLYQDVMQFVYYQHVNGEPDRVEFQSLSHCERKQK